MKFRIIDIPILIFQVLRPNYSLKKGNINTEYNPVFNRIYKFLFCCLYYLKQYIDDFENKRKKYLMIAACQPCVSQISNVLNKLYGTFGPIRIENQDLNEIYWFPDNSFSPIYIPTNDTDLPYYLGFAGVNANDSTIFIPNKLVIGEAALNYACVTQTGRIIAIGLNHIYYTDDEWDSYSKLELPSGTYKAIVCGKYEGEIVAIGEKCGAVSYDNGDTWVPIDVGDGIYNCICMTSVNDNMYAFGENVIAYSTPYNRYKWNIISSNYVFTCCDANTDQVYAISNGICITFSDITDITTFPAPDGVNKQISVGENTVILAGNKNAYNLTIGQNNFNIIPSTILSQGFDLINKDDSSNLFIGWSQSGNYYATSSDGNTWDLNTLSIPQGTYNYLFAGNGYWGIVGNKVFYIKSITGSYTRSGNVEGGSLYTDFISTLNSLMLYGLNYTIKIY